MDDQLFAEIVQGNRPAVCRACDGSWQDGPLPKALLPGSFNPLHDGHTALAAAATQQLGFPVAYEISLTNVDKPDLAAGEIERRLAAFRDRAPVWITRAATFARKAELFPGCVFILGYDTAVRLIDVKYYGDEGRRNDALQVLRMQGCRVLVGGRCVGGRFQVWDESAVAREFRDLFTGLDEHAFRVDRSSTELRAK